MAESGTGAADSCPLCKQVDQTVVSDRDRHGAPLRTVICQSCGHVCTSPRPSDDDLKSFYEEQYRADYKGTVTPKLKHVYRAGVRALEREQHLATMLKPESRLLDIGSGGGEFVYLMTARGVNARGIEPNRGYADFSRTAYGIDVTSGRIEDEASDPHRYDIITLHHVLEHVADPVEVLTQLRDRLSVDGKLVIEVPNVEARYHAPKRQFHRAHLHTFSIEGLVFAGGLAGFTSIASDILPHTRHIRTVFTPAPGANAAPPGKTVAQRIERHLRSNTAFRDTISARPYRRLWANAKRPLKERMAMRALGSPGDAKTLLDRLYASALGS